MNKQWFGGMLLSAVMAVSGGMATQAAEKTLRLSHLNPNDPFKTSTAAMAVVFENLMESGTNGAIDVVVYPDGQLGKEQEILQQMKLGLVQSAIVSMGGLASVYPPIGVLDVPFAFPDISTTYAVFDGPFGQTLAQHIEQSTGLAVLGYGDSGGFFAFTNSKRQIHNPDEMDGLRIRTMTLETHQKMIEALGAQPTAISWPEVYTSLETGVVDGQMNPIPVIKIANLDETQQYLTLTNHLFTPYIWVFRREFLDGLSEAERRALDNAVTSAVVAGRGISRIIEASDRGLPALTKTMDVYAPTAEERALFQAKAQPEVTAFIRERYGEEGAALLDAFLSAIEGASSAENNASEDERGTE